MGQNVNGIIQNELRPFCPFCLSLLYPVSHEKYIGNLLSRLIVYLPKRIEKSLQEADRYFRFLFMADTLTIRLCASSLSVLTRFFYTLEFASMGKENQRKPSQTEVIPDFFATV